MKFKFTSILVLLCLICSEIIYAQKNKLHFQIELDHLNGDVINTNNFVGGDNLELKPITSYSGYSIKIGLQNPAYKDWQKVYKIPYYGIGVSQFNLHSKEIGKPVSVFGYLGFPILRYKILEIYGEFQYGLATNWQHFNEVNNPKNEAIGSKITVHAAASIPIIFHLSNHVDIGVAYGFTHFSNGRFERPNNGVNLRGSQFFVKTHLPKRPKFKPYLPATKDKKKNEFVIYLGYGDHQREGSPLDTNYFAIAGITPTYYHQHTRAFRSGIGMDMTFWWSLSVNEDGTQARPTGDNLTIGLIYQPEFIIGNLSLVGGIGIYGLHKEYGNFSQLYQRLGARYNFGKDFSFGVNIRAVNFYQAEFLEFQAGYHF